MLITLGYNSNNSFSNSSSNSRNCTSRDSKQITHTDFNNNSSYYCASNNYSNSNNNSNSWKWMADMYFLLWCLGDLANPFACRGRRPGPWAPFQLQWWKGLAP